MRVEEAGDGLFWQQALLPVVSVDWTVPSSCQPMQGGAPFQGTGRQ